MFSQHYQQMLNLQAYQEQIYTIIGAAFEVHKVLRAGLLEPVYNEALCRELCACGVVAQAEVDLPIYYKGELLEKRYRMDMVCGDIVLELKSVTELLPEHRAQLANYLRLTHKPIGLLINFGEDHLHAERYYYDEETNRVNFFH